MGSGLSYMLAHFNIYGKAGEIARLFNENDSIEPRSIQQQATEPYEWNWAILVLAALSLIMLYSIRDRSRRYRTIVTAGLGAMLCIVIAIGSFVYKHPVEMKIKTDSPEYEIVSVEMISQTAELMTVGGHSEDEDSEPADVDTEQKPENTVAKAEDTTPAAKAEESVTEETVIEKPPVEEPEPEPEEASENELPVEEPEAEDVTGQEEIVGEIVEPEKVVTIQITPGMDSGAIARLLEENGLVKNAASFDRFLCDNGYDRKLRTGDFEITVGTGEEELAEILTRRQ